MYRRACSAVVLLIATACGSEPPALTVGDVAFGESELLGLNEARRLELATLTAFGLSTARGETLYWRPSSSAPGRRRCSRMSQPSSC